MISKPSIGFVSVVGAGPGDPELLTLKANRRLKTANLVLYDALVPPSIVAKATRAQCFCVGKRAGMKSVNQDTIHHLMVRGARQGKMVVRLKSGDPFVLGRGGEEVLALKDAGIPFEIIPGVTSAVAAPQAAGIPVTHRDVASAFAVVSGHAVDTFKPILETLSPNSMTIVVLMGLRNRSQIAAALLKNGWRRDTPVAIITAASRPDMEEWTGQLKTLGNAQLNSSDSPGSIVIGDVVDLAAHSIKEPDTFAISTVAFGH